MWVQLRWIVCVFPRSFVVFPLHLQRTHLQWHSLFGYVSGAEQKKGPLCMLHTSQIFRYTPDSWVHAIVGYVALIRTCREVFGHHFGFLRFFRTKTKEWLFSERDWSATTKDGGEKRRKTKLGDSNMSANPASWHTDGEGTQVARPVPTRFLED